jgi:hypothetical protein
MSTIRPLYRPAGAPAYYLGRAATTWLKALDRPDGEIGPADRRSLNRCREVADC